MSGEVLEHYVLEVFRLKDPAAAVDVVEEGFWGGVVLGVEDAARDFAAWVSRRYGGILAGVEDDLRGSVGLI